MHFYIIKTYIYNIHSTNDIYQLQSYLSYATFLAADDWRMSSHGVWFDEAFQMSINMVAYHNFWSWKLHKYILYVYQMM